MVAGERLPPISSATRLEPTGLAGVGMGGGNDCQHMTFSLVNIQTVIAFFL